MASERASSGCVLSKRYREFLANVEEWHRGVWFHHSNSSVCLHVLAIYMFVDIVI